jgi:hypothetical protein
MKIEEPGRIAPDTKLDGHPKPQVMTDALLFQLSLDFCITL